MTFMQKMSKFERKLQFLNAYQNCPNSELLNKIKKAKTPLIYELTSSIEKRR